MKDRELFSSDRPVRSDFSRGRPSYALRRIATVFVVLAIVCGGLWVWSHSSTAPGEIPTIKAEGDYKEKPDEPGGIDIPHQDVQVYHEIDGSQTENQPAVEHMLPPPEQPTAPPAIAADASAVTPPAPQVETIMPAAPGEVKPVMAAAAPEPVAPAAPPPAVVPVPAVAAKAVPAPSAPPVPAMVAPAAKGGVIIQFAASSDEHAAKVMAQKLQTKYHSVLGSAHLRPVRADLGAKGVFYRIQSQPLPETQAKSICASVKKMNAGCLLVRP